MPLFGQSSFTDNKKKKVKTSSLIDKNKKAEPKKSKLPEFAGDAKTSTPQKSSSKKDDKKNETQKKNDTGKNVQHTVTTTEPKKQPGKSSNSGDSKPPSKQSQPSKKDIPDAHGAFYGDLRKRITRRKNIYNTERRWHEKWSFRLFTLPLILIQLLAAVFPMFLSKHHPHLNQILTVLFSALSAAWITTDAKLMWGQKTEKFRQSAQIYNMLAQENYLMSTEAEVAGGNPHNKIEVQKQMAAFLTKLAREERRITQLAPVPSDETIAKVDLAIAKKDALKKKNIKNVEKRKQAKKLASVKKLASENTSGDVSQSTPEKEKSSKIQRKVTAPGVHAGVFSKILDLFKRSDKVSNMGEENDNTKASKQNPAAKVETEISNRGNIKPSTTNYNIENIAGSDISIRKVYSVLYDRFTRKRRIYQVNERYYDQISFTFFMLPLLLLQVTNSIVAIALEKDKQKMAEISTVISAVCAGWIGAQVELGWEKKAEQFRQSAKVYDLLSFEAYFRKTESQGGVKTRAKLLERMLEFISYTGKLEKRATNNCPLPVARLVRKVEKEIEEEIKQANASTRESV